MRGTISRKLVDGEHSRIYAHALAAHAALLEQTGCGTDRPISGLIGYVDGRPRTGLSLMQYVGVTHVPLGTAQGPKTAGAVPLGTGPTRRYW